jgi:hypothetical protein
MSQLLTLQVPADAQFHALAVEAAERIGSMAGVGAAQAGAFAQGVREALADMAAAPPGQPDSIPPMSAARVADPVVLAFETDPGSVRVTMTCRGRAREVRCERSGAAR